MSQGATLRFRGLRRPRARASVNAPQATLLPPSPIAGGVEERLPGRLGTLEATSFVVAYVVGLYSIGLLLGVTPDVGWALALLAIGAVYTLMGSLVYAELGTRFPRAGGEYAFVERAFGARWGFFRAWASFALVIPATLALIAEIDVQFMERVFGALTPLGERVLAILLLSLGCWVNLFGIRTSGRVMLAWIAIKLAALGLLVVGAFGVLHAGLMPSDALRPASPPPGPALLLLVAAVPVAMLLYDGAYDVVALAEDLRDSRRSLPRALLFGLAASAALFVVMALGSLAVLGYHGAGAGLGVFDAIGASLGPAWEVAALGAYATVGYAGSSAILLSGSRYAFGAARDGHFFGAFAWLHPRLGTPVPALLLVWAVAVGFVLLGDIRALVSFYVSALGFLSFLAIAALLKFRRTGEGASGHFQAPGGAWLPLAWAFATTLVTGAALLDASRRIGLAGAALVVVMLGLAFPVHAAARRRGARASRKRS